MRIQLKLFALAASSIGLALIAAPAAEAQTVAKIESLFPSCSGMLTQADVDGLVKSSVDPLERFEAWRRKRHSMIEAPPVTACRSKVWRHLHDAVHTRPDGVYDVSIDGFDAPFAGSLDKNGVASANKPLASGVTDYQGEVQVAVNPNNPSWMVAGANTFFRDPAAGCQAPAGAAKTYGTQALYGSTDGGATWTYQCAPWPATVTGSVSSAIAFFGSDPAMAWDNNGNAYAAYMLLSQNASNVVSTAIVVAKSTNAGTTWAPLGTVVNNLSTSAFDDKEMLAVDNSSGAFSHPGRLFVIWDENNQERIAYSDDGTTWTTHAFSGTGISVGADVKIGADGTVYAVWNRVYNSNNLGQAQADDTYFSKSTDGGTTWTAPVKIFTHTLASFQTYYTVPAQDERGVNSFPSLDIDRNPSSPFFNRLYIAYAETTGSCCPLISYGYIDVYERWSSDGGTTWSPRVKVNDDASGVPHFFPWLGVDQSDGTVNLAWYDTRNDAVDQERTQIYYARSVNGGTSFETNVKLTDSGANFADPAAFSEENSFTNSNANANQYGDYMGCSATNRKVTVAWADSRQLYPSLTTKREDIATASYTNCSAPRLSVPHGTTSASGVTVTWSVQTWGVNATGGNYTLVRYANSTCSGFGIIVGTYGSLVNSALDSPPASGTYYYGVTAKNNCPGTTLTPMSSHSCSAAVNYVKMM
jgi:hypothetical protein